MVPIELLWFVVVLLFGLIGIVRGYLKELGVTTVMVIMLFGLITFEGRLAPVLAKVASWLPICQPGPLQAGTWVVVLIVVGFVSYHGQTLAFEGKLPQGATAVFLNLGAGLVNGYLIAGSIWYYLHQAGYPLLPVKAAKLTALAKVLLTLMPPALLAPYLLYVGIFLMLMRVIR